MLTISQHTPRSSIKNIRSGGRRFSTSRLSHITTDKNKLSIADKSSDWILLRSVRLHPISQDFSLESVELCSDAQGATKHHGNKLRFDAKVLQSIFSAAGFTTFEVPNVTELCGLRLDNQLLPQSTIAPIRVSASPPDGDGIVTVSIHADLRQLFASMVTSRSSDFSWRLTQSAISTTSKNVFGVNSVDVDGMGPDSASTPSEFKIPLMPHQRSSLAWMIMRESVQELCVHERRCQKPLKEIGAYLNLELQVSEVFSLCGGVLCDAVGSGKTATTLSLICSHDRPIRLSDDLPNRISKATLVLCPSNVHAQWLTEVEKFCPCLQTFAIRAEEDLKNTSHDLLMQADLVVAPYELFVVPGVDCSADALKDIRWHRVVLDEFHELCSEKDFKKKLSLQVALKFLKTDRQWALSGTPEAFLQSPETVETASNFFRVDINQRTAHVFVEHFCRQSRVTIPVEVHEHVVHVEQTPAERTLYLAQSKESDGDLDAAHLQKLLFLCSHFLPESASDSPTRSSNLSADEVCVAMLQQKEDAFTVATNRVNDLCKTMLLDFCMAVETLDQKISSIMTEMKSSLVHLVGLEHAEDQKKKREALDSFSLAVSEPLQIKNKYLKDIMSWCGHDGKVSCISLRLCIRGDKIVGVNLGGRELFCIEAPDELKVSTILERIAEALERDTDCVQIYEASGVLAADCTIDLTDLSSLTVKVRQAEVMQLLDIFSPSDLIELCSAVSALTARVKPSFHLSQRLTRPCHILGRACELFLGAQRELNYFSRTWETFRAGTNMSCPVCLEEMDVYSGNFLICGHAICVGCTKKLIESRCPVCRCQVDGLTRASGPSRSFKPKVVPARAFGPTQLWDYKKHWSSKMCSMLETLRDIHASDPSAKVLIFSQWDSLRSHVSRALRDRGVQHLSLEGSIFERSQTLEQFRSDPSISLLLLSLEDSASGTNLTVASHVFLLHPMLAPSPAKAACFEAQAVGRVRRLGQERPVHVWRFITTGTIEEDLCERNANHGVA